MGLIYLFSICLLLDPDNRKLLCTHDASFYVLDREREQERIATWILSSGIFSLQNRAKKCDALYIMSKSTYPWLVLSLVGTERGFYREIGRS